MSENHNKHEIYKREGKLYKFSDYTLKRVNEIIERYPSRRLKISDGALLDCDGDTNVWAMESSAIICWWCQHYNETISWNYTIFLYYICA